MPVHDWTRVRAGLFHAFHHSWITSLSDALNMGVLPPDYFALPEQRIGAPVPEVLTLQLPSSKAESPGATRGIAVATSPPRTRLLRRAESDMSAYARKADRIAIRHEEGHVVAVIEIVSPGNKGSTNQLRTFVEKTSTLIEEGVHVLVIDLFPPSKRDPQGIHKAIWDEIEEEDFDLPADKRLVLASYDAGGTPVVYVEPIAVGDVLPDMPIFLTQKIYVQAPLESSYQTAWNHFPAALKGRLESSSANSTENL